MIRKAVIVALTLAAAGTGVTCSASIVWSMPFYSSRVVEVGVIAGVMVIECPGPISVHGVPPWSHPALLGTSSGPWIFSVPLWMLSVLLSVYPSIAYIRGPLRRSRRREQGLCLACGYNLTGNVSGVCPECATDIKRR